MKNFNKILNFNKEDVLEIFGITLYLYIVFFLFFIIKPSVLTMSIFFMYCLASTYYIYIVCKKFNKKTIDLLIIFFYSLLCVISYYIIHTYKNIILNSVILKSFLLLTPILYYILMKISHNIYKCNDYNFFFTPLKIIVNIVKKMKHFNKEIKI